MTESARLQQLRDRYLEMVEFEQLEFGVQPTELRHLMGRLGELECAIRVGGTLAKRVNQPGFDVVGPDGRRISVKTTAQVTGFVPISAKTLPLVDDLMVLQYRDQELHLIYHGDIDAAIAISRKYSYSGSYELDISKARRLGCSAKGDA